MRDKIPSTCVEHLPSSIKVIRYQKSSGLGHKFSLLLPKTLGSPQSLKEQLCPAKVTMLSMRNSRTAKHIRSLASFSRALNNTSFVAVWIQWTACGHWYCSNKNCWYFRTGRRCQISRMNVLVPERTRLDSWKERMQQNAMLANNE